MDKRKRFSQEFKLEGQAGVGIEPVKDLLNVVVDGCPADTVIATIGVGKGPKGVAAGIMPTK